MFIMSFNTSFLPSSFRKMFLPFDESFPLKLPLEGVFELLLNNFDVSKLRGCSGGVEISDVPISNKGVLVASPNKLRGVVAGR